MTVGLRQAVRELVDTHPDGFRRQQVVDLVAGRRKPHDAEQKVLRSYARVEATDYLDTLVQLGVLNAEKRRVSFAPSGSGEVVFYHKGSEAFPLTEAEMIEEDNAMLSREREFDDGARRAVQITPQEAAEMLSKNAVNRHLRKYWVTKYARDMAAGNWRLKGQVPLMFDRAGHLLNGQHRLKACVEAGVPFWTYIELDCDAADRAVVDTGATRTLGDVLHWAGEQSSLQLATVIRVAWLYETRRYRTGVGELSRSEALAFLAAHPGLRDSLIAIQDLVRPLRVGTGPIAVLHYYAHQAAPREAALFFEGLRMAIELPVGSPILALRAAWLGHRKIGAGTQIQRWQLGLGIKAFNAYRSGRALQRLALRTSEAFPEFVQPRRNA